MIEDATLSAELVQSCRRQFPALSRVENGQPVVFFDGPAGTQVPQRVADAVSDYLLNHNANHGGSFATSRETDLMLAEAHQAHADLVGADDGAEVMFGQNMTSLTFAFSRALAKTWQPGDEIVVTALDHDANLTPWALAARDAGVTMHVVGYRDDDWTLDLDELASRLNERTRLVAVGCASNATGTINPVQEVTSMAHQVGALSFLDAVHFGPHALIDVKRWGCDVLACSDYKFFGPHLGMMWGRRELLEQLDAYKVRPAKDSLPGKWMTGTQSHESIVGGKECIDYLADLGRQLVGHDAGLDRRRALQVAFESIQAYEQQLSLDLITGLQSIPGLQVIGLTDPGRVGERFPTFSIRHNQIAPAELANRLADRGICVWSGNYYALEFSQRLGFEPEGMVRIGLVHYNTPAEIARLVETLNEIIAG
jgi:cysteine desulfurase family protein (TIGR01976 family)